MAKRMAESKQGRKNEMFLSAVQYLAVKYQIENYTVITKDGYHVEDDDYSKLEVKKELVKLFQWPKRGGFYKLPRFSH